MRMSEFNSELPKEQLTAFQRWELPSFDVAPKTVAVELAPVAQHVIDESTAANAAAELQKIKSQAHDEGYTTGYSTGLLQAQAETAKLQNLLQNLQIALTQTDEQLAQSLLELSLEIAHKMVVEALRIKPEIILKVIRSAISSLPHFNQNAHLIMHPDDAELVRRDMGEELAHAGWKIFTDTKIEPGGCRIETAHSNIDATNTARWQKIVASIGQDKSWLTT